MGQANDTGGRDRSCILIVDDHDGVRGLLRTWLGDVFPDLLLLDASTGEEAVALAVADPPHLVLMDVQLPGIDGMEATRRIKASAPQTRVVMLTSLDDMALRVAASAAGASAYVSKHTMHTELIPLIQALRTPLDANGERASDSASTAGTNLKGDPRRRSE